MRYVSDVSLVNVLPDRVRIVLNLIMFAWVASVIVMFFWWFSKHHVVSIFGFILSTVLVFWSIGMTGYFFFFIRKMKKVNPSLELPKSWRVAMVVTKAPSEPFDVVKTTVLAMLRQKTKINFDVWLADELPTPEVLSWCVKNGVYMSSRMGNHQYHRDSWPRRTKCKEGNLAYFYDNYGYKKYDFVVQLDADHVPEDGYLESMLRPFLDDKVGYVPAPSICDKNASISWVARARLYAEASLHGPLQSGYTDSWAPLCIGSHYAICTSALREVGGLGPELAEDHSTTLLLNAHGWKGVHAIDAIARGFGPGRYEDAMTQEYQWSKSLIVLLLTLTPRVIKTLPVHLKFQFIFSQLWYPIFAMVMFFSVLMPIVSVVFNLVWVNINYFEFLAFTIWPTIFSVVAVSILAMQDLLRPSKAKIFSWEFAFFQFARWPWVLWACVVGVWETVTNAKVVFKVTPKGNLENYLTPIKVVAPYILISLVCVLSILYGSDDSRVSGYYYFVTVNALVYLLVGVLAVFKKA